MKPPTKTFAFRAFVSTLYAVHVTAFWRMPCLSRSGLARVDPLVSFNTVSEHMHAIHGSSGFSETAAWADLVDGDCTSCSVSQDKSAYWTPPLYFKDATTGKFELVTQEGGMLAYYLLYPNSNDPTQTVHAFPEGFRMIAGDTNQRNFTYPVPDIEKSLWTGEFTSQEFLRQAALGFNCLNYAIAPEGSLYRHFLPDKAYIDANCKDGIRFELMFPSCWNGENDPLTFREHVAYPSQVMTGDCPAGFDQRLVSLFYETIWRTEDFIGRDGEFVIANGDPTGYGYHGDFMMGWNGTFLQEAVDQCRDLSGRIEDCPLFDIQSSDVYDSCSITTPAALSNEKATSDLDTLPGNPAIAYGPEYAKGISPGGAGSNPPPASSSAPAVVPTLSHSDGVSLASSETFVPGAVFAVQTTAALDPTTPPAPTPSSDPTTAPNPTTAPAPPPIVAAEDISSQSFFSTDYQTSGYTVNEILWVEELVTVTIPYTDSVTVTAAAHKRHLHKHRGLRF